MVSDDIVCKIYSVVWSVMTLCIKFNSCVVRVDIVYNRDQEDRQFPVLFRFRIRQTDLFREKPKKIGPKINLFSVEYLN